MDIISQSRKYLLQRQLSIQNSQGVRLSYARWLLILGLFIQIHLASLINNKAFATGTPDTIIVSYLVLNVAIWAVSATFAKTFRLMVPITLGLDLMMSLAVSYAANSPIFFFAFVPAFLLMLMIGLWEGVSAFIVVALVNVGSLLLNNYDASRNSANLLWPQLLLFAATMVVIAFSIYILTQSSTSLLRVQPQMLEEALARANEANLVELQNRAKAIYRVTNTLSATLDYEEVVKSILEELETVFDVEVGMVLLFDQTLSSMKVANSIRLTPPEELKPIEIGSGPVKQILLKGEPMLLGDNRQSDSLPELRRIFPSLQQCKSVLVMPLRAGFEVFGLVLIASKDEYSYGTNDLELMATLTTHVVIAMQNARLYRNLLEDRNKILTREEEFRHELARNLHDGPAQAVAAFSMQAEFIRRLFKADPDRAIDELTLLGKQAQQTSKEIRTLLFGLRPLVLESQGLAAALEQYASRFPTQPNDPTVHFSATSFEGRFDLRLESTIFTILQEAVNNARKHAQARNIWLHLEIKDGYIVASAQDDGRGFDLAAVESNYDQRGSLGLTNMRERAQLVGGSLNMASAPGKGTSIIIRVPLN